MDSTNNNRVRTRCLAAQRQRQYKKAKKDSRKNLLEEIWSLYPTTGFTANFSQDNKDNYGLHGNTLNFKLAETHKVKCGSCSMGRYENGHLERKYNRLYPEKSLQHLKFLDAVRRHLETEFPEHKGELDYMRVNCVQGAQSIEHTDTMRGVTPNFVFIKPGSNFQLRVRQFPLFKNSVVKYCGEPYIPHQHKESVGLTMIGRFRGKLCFLVFPPKVIDMVEPYGNLPNCVVVGVHGEKLQVVPSQYSVHHTTRTMPLIEFDEAVAMASQNRSVKPRYLFRYIKNEENCTKEHLWNKAHRHQIGSNHDCCRFYAFFRPVREETPSARLRGKNHVMLNEHGTEIVS